MAEIKSTMELVMERAARMGRASEEEIEREELRREGMRLAAGFLDKGGADPARLGEGISRALVTTLAGLVVAIPGLLVHAGLAALAQAQENRLLSLGNRLSLGGGPALGERGKKDRQRR